MLRIYKLILWFVLGYSIGTLIGLWAYQAMAIEIVQPKSVGLEFEKYRTLRDPYIPEDDSNWRYGVAMTTQFTLVGQRENNWRLFIDPSLRFRGTHSQIREGSLYWEAGGEIKYQDREVRLFHRHESRHVLEYERPSRTFPLLDSWVLQTKWEIN